MAKGHECAHVKHETSHLLQWRQKHLLQWRQKHLEQHHGIQFIPHHGNNEGGSQLNLGTNHKCNKSTQELKDKGGSTWCATWRRKH